MVRTSIATDDAYACLTCARSPQWMKSPYAYVLMRVSGRKSSGQSTGPSSRPSSKAITASSAIVGSGARLQVRMSLRPHPDLP